VCILWDAVSNGWLPPKRAPISKEEYEAFRRAAPSPLRSVVAYPCSIGGRKWGGLHHNCRSRPKAPLCYESARTAISRQASGIIGSKIIQRSYLEIDVDRLFEERGECLVYCDPPYANTLDYKSGSFDSGQFWDWVRNMSRRHAVVVSEYTAPDDFVSIFSKERKQDINHKVKTEHLWMHK
jgi:DNA adenine methylase